MPPITRKVKPKYLTFEEWRAQQEAELSKAKPKPGLLSKLGSKIKNLTASSVQKRTAIDQLSNIGKLIPQYNPRIFSEGGKISIEIAGNPYTLEEALKLFSKDNKAKAALPGQEPVFKALVELQKLEGMLQKLPPPEGGRLASFEEAAAIAALKGSSDPTSAHYDPMRTAPKGKFNKREIEESRAKEKQVLKDIKAKVQRKSLIPQPGTGMMTAEDIQREIKLEVSKLQSARRVKKDIGGTPAQPSNVEALLHPAASKLIKSGSRAIESLGDRTNNPGKIAKTISRLFTQADVLVKDQLISQEVADSIRNRMAEVLIRTPGGKEVLAAIGPGDVRARRGKVSAAEGFYQDTVGDVQPKEGPVASILKHFGGGTRGTTPQQHEEDRVAEAWRKALSRQGPEGITLPPETKESPLDRIIRLVEGRRMKTPTKAPTETPLPISRTRGGVDSADIRALKALSPQGNRVPPEVQEILGSTSDPELLLQKLSKVLGRSPEELAPHVDRFLGARADALRRTAIEVNKPSSERVAVITGTTKSGKSKGASQVEQMSLQEAQALAEVGDRPQAIWARPQPPMSVPRQGVGASVTRGMERATTAPYEDQQRQILERFVRRLQSSGVPMEKIAAILRYIS